MDSVISLQPTDLACSLDNLGCSPDDLGCSLDDLGGCPDDLGCSLDDLSVECSMDDLGSNLDNLGCSLDELGTSDISIGLGISLENIADMDQLEFEVEPDEMKQIGQPLCASTPSKALTNFHMVYAKPKPLRSLDEYIRSETRTQGKMGKKALDLENINNIKMTKCKCGQSCKRQFGMKEIYQLRENYWTRPKFLKFSFLIELIKQSDKIGKRRFMYLQRNKKVCTEAFLQLLRIDKKTLNKAVNLASLNKKTVSNLNSRSVTSQTLETITWLEDYARYHGDRMPHKEDVFLPYKSRKNEIYSSYRLDYPTSHVSRSQFYKIWSDHFPHLKIKKTNCFSRCNTCYGMERECEKTTCPTLRAKYKSLKGSHVNMQMMERAYYHEKRVASEKEPSTYMSIIIDGMDQGKTQLPRFAGRPSKLINHADLLKTHVTGILDHGQGTFSTYVDYQQYPHDPNLTINVILKHIEKVAQKEDQLPKVLYVQADNCFRENKNRFALGFLELLVTEKIFNEVHMSFLPVGHTHEDVDAGFSRIADKLKHQDVETLPELISVLPQCELLQNVYDVKSWLATTINNVSHISKPLHFKFSNIDGNTKSYYKGKRSEPWKLMETTLLRETPAGRPSKLIPNFEKVSVENIKKQVRNIKSYFKDPAAYEWWQEFLTSIENRVNSEQTSSWILPHLPRQRTDIESVDPDVPIYINELLEKEHEIPELTVRPKKKKNPEPARNPKSANRGKGNQKHQTSNKKTKGRKERGKAKQ